jgi:hypothetical protein
MFPSPQPHIRTSRIFWRRTWTMLLTCHTPTQRKTRTRSLSKQPTKNNLSEVEIIIMCTKCLDLAIKRCMDWNPFGLWAGMLWCLQTEYSQHLKSVLLDSISVLSRTLEYRTIRKLDVVSGFGMVTSLDRFIKKRVIKIFYSWQNGLG